MKSLSRQMRRMRGWVRAWHFHFTQPVGKLLGASWRRTLSWSRGLRVRLFLQGLPALLAGIGLVVLTAFSLMAPAHEVETRYFEQGQTAFRAKDYPLALTCFERVCAQGGERPEVLYQLAQTAEALGQMERAALLMQQSVLPDKQGYGEAHLWVAIRLQLNNAQVPAVRLAMQAHLLRALQGEIKNRELAHGMLGDLYLVQDQLEQAELHLSKAVKTLPHYRIRLAVLYDRRGDGERARSAARSAVAHFQPLSKANLYDHQARMGWARAVTFLKQFPEAVAILNEGWTTTGDTGYRLALGEVYAEWCNYQVLVKGEPAQDQLVLVEKGLSYDPTNLALANRLLAAVTAGGEKADKARAALQGLLASGKASGIAHFALGVDAWQRGDKKQAGLHWEQAHRLAPHLTEVANTLAMHLASVDPPDLPRALELINQVLDKVPNHPNYRDTRGQIYVKMGKWKEALPDLEMALSKSPDPSHLHRTLATVYERLDVPAMAAEHQRRADQLDKAAKKKIKG